MEIPPDLSTDERLAFFQSSLCRAAGMVKNPLYKFKETRYNKENIGQEGCPMARMGFIQDKLEIKFLLLYIASRLIEPVPFEAMQALEEATGRTAPASLAVLRQKAERFSTVIDPAQIAEVALGCQA